ncbi:MAG: PEP-CTERM sorting domain-containing protein [Caenispirillum bisanense]|nr:PEP-CTERM sorting domain-containing protein [Caenispirillum bisanense]MCA1974159.1 PEP-CTERM sorting domain-containing protein [Caenispirillum sp.]
MMVKSLKYAALAGALALSVATAGAAKADVYGYSNSQFSNVTLNYASGGVVDLADFSYLSFTDTVGGTAFLSTSGTVTAPTVTDDFSYNGTNVIEPIDGDSLSTAVCVENGGACSPTPGTDFARTEASIEGAIVSGVRPTTGLTSVVMGESRVDGDTIGRATSTNTSQGGVEFELELGGTGTVDLVLSLDYLIDLFVAHEIDGSIQDASAGASFFVTILGNGSSIVLAPEDLNVGVAISEEFTSAAFSETGSVLLPITLDRGVRYNFSINHTATTVVNAQLVAVPEPGTVGLLGAGLAMLGIGAIRRRRGDKAA